MKFSAKPSSIMKFAIVLFAGVMAFGAAGAQQISIGMINTQRIRAGAPQMKAADARLKQEFDKRIADLQDMEGRINAMQTKYDKDAPTMTEADRARSTRDLSELAKDYQRRKRELQEDFNQRRNEEEESALKGILKVVQQVAEENKIDVVFQEGSAAYVNPRIDITDKVLKALNK